MALTISQMSSGISPSWLSDAFTSMRNSMSQGGIMGALQSSASGGSLSSLIQSSASTFATISQNSVSAGSNLAAQIASQTLQQRQQDQLQKALDGLQQTQQMVQPTNVLDPYIYFSDGSSIDTNGNILTKSDGTKIDITTGTEVVDPSSIIQMANGAYLNTSTNVLTMSDGTKIDTVTGLLVSQLS